MAPYGDIELGQQWTLAQVMACCLMAPNHYLYQCWLIISEVQLEQLELMRSEISPTATWLPILVIHIRSQVKTRQSQSYKFYKIAKNSNFEIWQETYNATHLLKLLDKMHKYEMDPTRTVGATERTRDAGRTDGRMEWNQYTPQQLRCVYNDIHLRASS